MGILAKKPTFRETKLPSLCCDRLGWVGACRPRRRIRISCCVVGRRRRRRARLAARPKEEGVRLGRRPRVGAPLSRPAARVEELGKCALMWSAACYRAGDAPVEELR